jgi:glycosyltransferase involved in cell wall biosynthesis
MKALVWQWGRRGAGPRVAVELAVGLRLVPGTEAMLSLSTEAEILRGPSPPCCQLPVRTYNGVAGFIFRLMAAPFALPSLARRVRALAPDVAICAMPGPLDLLLVAVLRRAGIPIVVIVHDADAHPGDGLPLQMALQRRLTRRADALVALTEHVAVRLREQGLAGTPESGRPLLRASLPPFVFGPAPPLPRVHGGKLRVLSFGRLLPYKGLDLLADALRRLGPLRDIEVRIVGSGPESGALAALRSLPNVQVENRWVPEREVGELLAWADALVLSHREASQSGVAAAAIAARRWVVSTRVGGLKEQLREQPLAVLCEANPDSLAAALRGLLEAPPAISLLGGDDPRAEWRRVAEKLLTEIDRALLARIDVPMARSEQVGAELTLGPQ